MADESFETEAPKAPPPIDGSVGDQEDPKVFVLTRELSEVHLLLDNLSANPGASLSALKKGAQVGLPEDWIEQVCQISWPPSGSPVDQAAQAALLIRVKDYLNGLSRPASGSTIAFTLLVTQEQDLKTARERLGAAPTEPDQVPTRSSLACIAYPDLIPKARNFRNAMWGMSAFLGFWLILTCLLSWYVAYGNAALGELAVARGALETAQKRVSDAEAGVTAATGPAPVPSVAVTGSDETAATAPPTPPDVVGYCNEPRLLGTKPIPGTEEALPLYASVGQLQACQALARSQAHVDRVQNSLLRWLRRGGGGDGGDGTEIAFNAASIANIWGSAILPVLYGILGAGAAIVRSLSRKIKASLLAPRDLLLSLQQLALGAVVGACIGLFISQPGGGGATDTSLLGPVALSGSAISFVAGFGVEAVFQALEALIARIFNTPSVASATRPDGPPAN